MRALYASEDGFFTEFHGLPGFEHRPCRYFREGATAMRHIWAPPNLGFEERDYVREVLGRDPCSYCGGITEALDHIEPQSKDGPNHWTNLTAACCRCNFSKGPKTLLHAMLHFRTKRDEWVQKQEADA